MRHSKQQIRETTWKHALRKQRISREVMNWEYYDNLHQYSKNKIHCSCGLCRRGNRTNSIHDLAFSDQKKVEKLISQLEEV